MGRQETARCLDEIKVDEVPSLSRDEATLLLRGGPVANGPQASFGLRRTKRRGSEQRKAYVATARGFEDRGSQRHSGWRDGAWNCPVRKVSNWFLAENDEGV
jgi:hypothetical protein